MMTPAQLELRRGLITATDAAAICSTNPWRTAYDVYADKKGSGPRFEGNARTRMGHRLEPIILASMREEHGWGLVANAETHVDSILPWLGATPDAFEYDQYAYPVGVGECKAVGADNRDWSDLEIPDYVLVQVTVQMHVSRVKRARVGKLVGTDLATYTVELDPDLDTAILERCDRFRREHLDRNVPPPVDGSDAATRMLAGLFPRSQKRYVELTPELDLWAKDYLEVKAAIKTQETYLEKIEQKFKLALADAEGVNGQGWKARWPTVEAAHVEAYDRKAYRRFTLTKGK